jgi:CheY-like chemotaxis protein
MARVLVVDDNKGLRLLFGRRLQRMGHTVFYANNGRDALIIAEALLPDMIFLDVHMPTMRGDEMLSILKRSAWGKEIKVALMSASDSIQYLANLHEADMVLFQPITGQELSSTLVQLAG